VFGVFAPGRAEAVFHSSRGEILREETLQAVDPREVFRLDRVVLLPEDAFRVSLKVTDTEGENLGYLGNVILR
jgi:DNA-binding transcriptional regulator YdaS (Cro superfamily)